MTTLTCRKRLAFLRSIAERAESQTCCGYPVACRPRRGHDLDLIRFHMAQKLRFAYFVPALLHNARKHCEMTQNKHLENRRECFLVAEKVARLRHKRGLSIRTALVYEGELAQVIRGNGYFDAIVSASDLLGL